LSPDRLYALIATGYFTADDVLNIVLLLALASVWLDTYRQIASKQTLGALVFALLLLAVTFD
jgi:hypothetical protein